MRSTRSFVAGLVLFVLLGIAGLAASPVLACSRVRQPGSSHQYDGPAQSAAPVWASLASRTTPAANVAPASAESHARFLAAVRLSGRGSRFLVAAEEGASGGTQLFRVTGPDETADINATGGYRVPEGGTEGKYFYPTEEQANAMAGKMAAQGYPSPLSLTSGYASPDVLGGFDSIAPAGEGPAYFAPGDSSSSLTNVTVHGQYP